MDLVDKEDVALFQVGEQSDDVGGAFECRSGGVDYFAVHFARDDGGEGGLAESGRAVQEDVVEYFAAFTRGLGRDLETADGIFLADIVLKAGGAQGDQEALFRGAFGEFAGGGYDLAATVLV